MNRIACFRIYVFPTLCCVTPIPRPFLSYRPLTSFLLRLLATPRPFLLYRSLTSFLLVFSLPKENYSVVLLTTAPMHVP